MRGFGDRRLAQIERVYIARQAYFVRVARAITGDPERAVEAVQDAFADVIRSRGSFRADGPMEAWIWRAVVNAARKAARPTLAELSAEPIEEQHLAAGLTELAPVIAGLRERQRLVIFLRYYADLDYRSIAAALGIEVGTVSAALAAAHRSVRKQLQEVSR
jgi:RNA polymerase sigma factor (sigma-70 family)